MRLDEILTGIDIRSMSGDRGTEITGISYDSRMVLPGHIFVAARGEKTDGHDFIEAAIKNGAAAVIHERPVTINPSGEVSFIFVKDSREALAGVANNFFRRPSRRLTVIGVTGTNGKTTTSYLIKSILEAWDRKVGLIGTIQYLIGDQAYSAPHTTPEAPDFQELLERMASSGCTYVVSEISSHALAQKRVDGTEFKTAVFTNLTRDHLDFHKTEEGYFNAKERLFRELLCHGGSAILNIDDPYGRRLQSDLSILSPEQGRVYGYGLETGPDLFATEINNSFDGLHFRIVMHGRTYNASSLLMGLPNVYNILSAAGACASLGVPWNIILDGIKNSGTIKGRFEKVDAGQPFLAIVDYAHTEDALERLIFTARGLTNGRIITVFGCGGDRDRGKRPAMGGIATRLSDLVIITSDNPRTERPEDIIREIEAGATRKNYLIEPDRKEAIRRAVLIAEDNDIVLLAGKGHESYQEMNSGRIPFSDREVLEEAIRQLIGNT
ncbi:MAG: UDP-N-acetylmuramoyl-L-alanyl-D-glutamate--2,6-diaminopimelate ligase [Nitrospirae bacterium]|nr:UDP-N-acetylmuramoyl-L-alanyl-D-glutamate--2,6-diaminopimelate ligase [Nitrospirota bacterium]